eukprot:574809_1
MQPFHGLRNHAKHTDLNGHESNIHWHRNAPDSDHKPPSTDSEDKGSLNAFRSLLNYGIQFNEEKLTDDTYGHARPYNLVLMSTRSLWIIYILFYAVIICSTVFSFKQAMFTSDVKIIETPSFIFLSDNASLIAHGYDPSDSVFTDPSNKRDTIINKSIANLYVHNDSFYPYQEYIYLYGHFTLNRDINTSDPFISQLLNGAYLFNYSVLLNITNNNHELGYETKYMQNTNFFNHNPCSINSECVFSIWSPYDDNGFSASWQNTILYNYKSTPNAAMLFNTTIVFYDFNLNDYGNFSLSYVYEKENWVQFAFYTKCTFAAITMICLILWIVYGLRIGQSKHRKELIAEQRWMVVLFIALLLYQDPLTVGLFSSDSFDALYLLSSLFFATSINLFMIYWSLMIDSIRQIKNLIDVGVTFGCKFYRFKLLAMFLSYASALVFTLTTQYLIQNNTENKSYNGYFYTQSDSAVVMTVLISGCIWITCVTCFVLWLFKSLWNANKELNKLPYIETRERQLSLRYFKHHTFLVIIYIILISIYNMYSHRSPLVLVDNRRVNLSTLTVVSVYVYLVAFMYLPMTNSNIKIAQHDFQLSNAILMCHIAWQSYLAPKNDDDKELEKETIDRVKLEYFDLELIQFVTNEQHDVQIIVSKGHIHTLFKKQKAQIHTERFSGSDHVHRHIHQSLLLAPKQSDHHRFLEDVSSEDDDAMDESISSEYSEVSVTTSSHHHSKSPRSSILSLDAIKTLFHMNRHKRARTVFTNHHHKRRIPGRYGAIEHNDLSVIKDDDEIPISPNLQKAFSLFSGQKSYGSKVNEMPLLSSYEDNISSMDSAAVRGSYDSQPVSVEYTYDDDEYHAPSLLHTDDMDTDLESVVTLHDDDDTDKEEQTLAAVSKQLNDLLDSDRMYRSQTLQHPQQYLFDAADEEEEKATHTPNKQRSSTLASHGFKKRKKHKRRRGFRIPLLSNLLPHDIYPNRRGRGAAPKVKYVDIVIGFRGTDSSVNVKLDLKFRRMSIDPSFWYEMALDASFTEREEWKTCVRPCLVDYDDHKEDNPLNIPYMKIHSGFYQSFKDIRNELMHTVLTTYYQIMQRNRTPRFFVTGHSLGGALAQLFGLCLEMLFGHTSLIHVYVYGCPRVGDKRFSDYLGERVKHLYRVVFRGDIVTTIPRGFAYYKHGGYEMVIDDHGNMINNPSKREKALLPSRTSLKDHSLQNYVDSLNAIAKKHKLPHLMVKVPS